MPTPKLSYSIAEAAEATGLSESHLRKEVKEGRLRVKASSFNDDGKPVGRRVVLASALQDYLEGLKDA